MRWPALILQWLLVIIWIVYINIFDETRILFDVSCLIFVILGTFFMTLAGFSWPDIKYSFITAYTDTDSEKNKYIMKSVYFFESLTRNFIFIGVLGTLISFVSMLANMSDPAGVRIQLLVSFLNSFYGIFFAGIISIPLYFSVKVRLKDVRQEASIHSHQEFHLFPIFGICMTALMIILGCFLGASISTYISLPAILIVGGIGLVYALMSDKEGAGFWQNINVGLSVAGLLGAVTGMIMMFSKIDDPSMVGPFMAISLLSLCYVLVLMIVLTLPMSDRTYFHISGTPVKIVSKQLMYLIPIVVVMIVIIYSIVIELMFMR